MTISIEAINFNHDPLSADTDALTIRRNQTDEAPVPEWRSGMTFPEASPAAYTVDQIRNNGLTIKAQFRRESSDPTTVEVRAVARGANVLGNVVSRTISFVNGVSAPETFQLNTASLNPGVGVWDIAWDWYAGEDFLQTTRHRIYTLVSAPQPPWGQPGSTFVDFQLPWTEVLDHACRQAAEAQTVDEAADKLTRWLFSLGESKLQYNEGSGDSCFTIPGMQTFKCTQFLQLLAADPGTRSRVNCTDCATILSSFANILGCNLVQSRIGFEFETNLIQKIGLTFPNRQYFNFHEIACKFPSNGNGNGNADALVYDFCLQFDGDTDRADLNFLPTLGTNIPLGVPGSEGYHFRLIAPSPGGNPPEEKPRTRVQRKIDGPTATRVVTEPDQERRLADKYDFPSWQGTPTVQPEPEQPCKCYHQEAVTSSPAALPEEPPDSDQQLPLSESFDQKRFSPSGWQLRQVEQVEAKPDPFKLTDAIWAATDCSAAELRVLSYECSSIAAARSFVLSLLGEFEVPSIKRRQRIIIDKKPVEIGDVAFADRDELVLVFARASTVVLIQNAGRTIVPVSGFAHEVDVEISNNQKLDNPRKEEESVMPDVRGSWSLRRLTSDGSSADLSVDGFIQIDDKDPSGNLRGRYADLKSQTVADVTGTVTHVAPNSFRLELQHSAGGSGITRQYTGQLIEMQEGDPGIQLVVGRFRHDYSQTEAGADSVGVFDSQESGIWVATKP